MSESKVAIVTGGAQGLGAAIVVVLLRKGYKVCVADIQDEKGKQFVKEQQEVYGSQNITFAVCDVSKKEDYRGIFDLTKTEFGRIDLVINNAGVVCEKDAEKCIDVNLMGTFTGCQLAFQYMGKRNGGSGGMVINVASILGFLPFHPLPAYCATKHGIIGLTRCFGHHYYLEKDGIFFAALCPSVTDTEILSKTRTNSLDPECDISKTDVIMSPEYVAEGVSKLLDDKINGSTLIVTKKLGYHYIGFQEEFKGIPIQ